MARRVTRSYGRRQTRARSSHGRTTSPFRHQDVRRHARLDDGRPMLNPHIFRAYDVRGRIGADINPDVFRQVGRAYATLIRRNGGRTIAVGPGQPRVVGRAQGRLHRGRARRRPRRRRHRRGHHADAVLRHRPLAAGRRRQHHRQPQPGRLQRREDGPPRRRPAQRGRDPGAAPHDRARATSRRGQRRRDGARARATTTSATVAGLVRPARRLRVVVDAGNGVAGLLRSRAAPPHRLRGRSSCTASRTGASPTTCPTPRIRRTSSTCRPRSSSSAPTSAWRGTATPIASGSSTSAGAVTRPIWSWSCSPAICCAGIPAPRSSST